MEKSCNLNLVNEILKAHSKSNTTRISKMLDNDPEKFSQLMNLFFNDREEEIARRAAWIMRECAMKNHHLIIPYLPDIVKYAGKQGLHQAIKRNILSVLEKVQIPEKLEGTVVDLCFRTIAGGTGESIAAKAYAMGVIDKLSHKYPGLLQELAILIGESYHHESSGFQARARKIIKRSKTFYF